ncbi:hypothetical protein DPX16_15476 [Anabarilius grahami]|uniref:Uncharacterized protein n=1 Tax=Anabarilius grahami TaxID=495550 RepID=A0A3N0XW73_ANAGA|nr:hypothetical protein DPX16_15476 [Anabarilius grahami]
MTEKHTESSSFRFCSDSRKTGRMLSSGPESGGLKFGGLSFSKSGGPGGPTAIGCTSCNGSRHLMCLGDTYHYLVTAKKTVTVLSACSNTAKEAVIKRSTCSDPTTEVIPGPPAYSDTTSEVNHELSVCPYTTTAVAHELSVSSDINTEVIPELSVCPDSSMEVIYELSACPVLAKEAFCKHSATATEAVCNLSVLLHFRLLHPGGCLICRSGLLLHRGDLQSRLFYRGGLLLNHGGL